MKYMVLAGLFFSRLAFASGEYSDESYVICDVDIREWNSVKRVGYLGIKPDSHDPFIHCARPSQMHEVMNKYFKGTTQMILITHPSKVGNVLRYENNYPHLYGKLYLEDVIYKFVKAPDANGYYDLPAVFVAETLSPMINSGL